MKKYFGLILVIMGVFLIGNRSVYAASSYWEDAFKGYGHLSSGCNGGGSLAGIMKWENKKLNFLMNDDGGGCGSSSYGEPFFISEFYSEGGIYTDVTNLQVNTNNEEILVAETRPYDFSREKKNYEDYIAKYETFTLKELNEEKFGIEESDKEKYYKQKPTWWEFNDYQTEPTTWWEAYKLDSEPANAVEVITKIKDLGKATITLSADGKSNITIDSTIQVSQFEAYTSVPDFRGKGKAGGLVEILNNLDKYKTVIGTFNYDANDSSKKNFNFSYEVEKDEDLSTIINALRGKDITVKFKENNGWISTTYYLNGKDITTTVQKGFTFYHNISMETSINKDKISNLVNLRDALYIDFAYHGNLPAPYTMKVNIRNNIRNQYDKINREKYCGSKDDYSQECNDKTTNLTNEQVSKYFENKKFTLLYYNPETNQMEIVYDGLTADQNGELELTFDHFSSYVIVGSDDYKITNNPQTSNINMIAYLLIAVASIVGISYLTISMKKRKND